nr:hypothetical protein [Tanacetum cinerariifolium]
ELHQEEGIESDNESLPEENTIPYSEHMFVPQKELSREQVYWQSPADVSPSTTPVKPFVKTRPASSQVREKLECIKKTFPGFEKLVKDNSVVRPLHVTEAIFERIKMIFEGQITPFFEWYKQRVLEFDDAIVKEVSKYKRIFDELETEYENTLLAKKKLQIANKNLLIQNDTLLASENLKNQRVLDNSNAMASNTIFEITLLKDQLRERDETVQNLQSEINISKMLNLGGND